MKAEGSRRGRNQTRDRALHQTLPRVSVRIHIRTVKSGRELANRWARHRPNDMFPIRNFEAIISAFEVSCQALVKSYRHHRFLAIVDRRGS